MKAVLSYLMLPSDVSPFERTYLAKTNRIALVFFTLHLPVLVLFAWANGTGPALAALLTVGLLVGPFVAYFAVPNPRVVSVLCGVTAMGMGGLLVHVGQGPVQIEMHFYFFALIAMLALFGNPMAIVSAAVTVAVHHLLLWFIVPGSVFNYDAPVWVVAVHAGFVVLESIGAVYIARSFFDNVIGLENVVVRRTSELRQRQADMRLVLDNVDQGFATIDRQGVLSAERSACFDEWFGVGTAANETVFDALQRRSTPFAEAARFGWEQVLDGFLPLELTLGQMPKSLSFDGRILELSYRPIGDGETPERFLVVVADVTVVRAAEIADEERREAMMMLERMLADRGAFLDFFEEASGLVARVTTGVDADDLPALKRSLHTLKGNCALFGLGSMADACHRLEDWMEAEASAPRPADVAGLHARWSRLSSDMDRLVGERSRLIEIEPAAHAALERAVRAQADPPTLLRMVHDLRLEPADRRLHSFAEQARRIASRLGKKVDVRVHGSGLRLDGRHWGPFWSAFVHAVRNTVDHGSEPTECRIEKGKPETAHIDLCTRMRANQFVVEIVDDGPGISWDRIAEKAAARGLPTATRKHLQDALFGGGISTARDVTDLSGRGVGMSALHEATRAMGGTVEIESELGRGTQIRFVFPATTMSPDFRAFGKPSRPPAAA